MAETKCDIHQVKLDEIEHRIKRFEDDTHDRLGRMENDMDSIISENHRRATEVALSTQAMDIFRDIIVRLENRIGSLESKIEAMLRDRRQILAGLLGNAAIGITMIGVLLWALEVWRG